MNDVLTALTASGRPSRQAIDEFIAANTFPMVEPRGVTFVYRGEAETVRLQHWIYGLPSSQALERIHGTDLWHLFLELPRESRIEYKFAVDTGGQDHWITDPMNPLTAEDPFGCNSVCRAYGYRRPSWTRVDQDTRSGSLETLAVPSQAFAETRTVQVYLPARFRRRRRYPLLIVHDGADFLRFADLKPVLDNLIDRLEIPPMIVALTQSDDRLTEYADDPRHAEFVARELLPAMEASYPLVERPEARALMGASFGAVASLSAAWRYPGLFDRLLLLSGSFGFSDIGDHRRGPEFDAVVAFTNAFRSNPGRPARHVYQACGIYESLIYENRSLVPILQNTGLRLCYREAPDGHNWENWRDRLQEALSWLFPGPLWMIYE